jgi:predicted alpha/beta-fold hydrolase
MTVLWATSNYYMSFAPTLSYQREELCSDDGNEIMLDWAKHEASWLLPLEDDTPIVFLIHGLGGDPHDPYIQRFADLCNNIGWRTVSYHWWRFDWMEARDLEIAINHVSKKFPEAPLAALGFSAGGHKLLKYLQFSGSKSPLVCAITVSAVMDLEKTYIDMAENGKQRSREISYIV